MVRRCSSCRCSPMWHRVIYTWCISALRGKKEREIERGKVKSGRLVVVEMRMITTSSNRQLRELIGCTANFCRSIDILR